MLSRNHFNFNKIFLLFSLLPFLGHFAATAQPKTTAGSTVQLFKIQLGAFRNLSLGKFDKLKTNELKAAVYSEDMGNGVTRVFVGDYKKQNDAETALEKVKTLGFGEAYIVAFDTNEKNVTKPIPPTTPEKNNKETPAVAQTNVKDTKTTPAAATAPAAAITPPPLPDTGKFWLQLGSFKQPDLKTFGNVADLGELFIEKTGDQTKITIGTYTKRSDAEKILNVVKKRGYNQAFIRVE